MLSQSITAAGAATLLAQSQTAGAAERPDGEPFGYCLNTSTIRGQKLPLPAEIDIAARAGYQGIEPWVNEIDAYVQGGGSLADLKKRIADQGLAVEGVIGFAEWIVDDDARRAKGLDEARRIMDLTAQIGGRALAAPPAGVSEKDRLDLKTIADRYRALLELGDQQGVVPQLELWGFARVLSRLSDVLYVAIETGHPQACVLARLLPPVQGRFGNRQPAPGVGRGNRRVPHQRLPGHARAKRHHRRPPRFPRRRRRPVGQAVSHAAGDRLSRHAVAGSVQSRVLDAGRTVRGAIGFGEDQAKRCTRHSPENWAA